MSGTPTSTDMDPFDNWLPGCYKGNINKVREACFYICCSSEQLISHCTNTILVVRDLTLPCQSSLPRTITHFVTASVRQGVKTVSAHPKPGSKIVPCIQQPWSPLETSSLNEENPVHAQIQSHTPILFYMPVVNDFRWYVWYRDFDCLFDLILYVHSTIFQLCGTCLPGLNQY